MEAYHKRVKLFSRIIIALTFSIISISGTAQSKKGKITGVIKNVNGVSIPYVNVYLKNALKGTITDKSGSFGFIAPVGNDTLIVSGIQYKTIEYPVTISAGKSIKLDLKLEEHSTQLKEAIVSAGRIEEFIDEVPSSVSVLNRREVKELSSYSNTIADVLTAIPGLPPSSNQTTSRGQTLRGRNTLVMIDGIPQSTPLRNGSRDINTIDPNTIERIEVIKGATSIYGNGADGGIINYITKRVNKTKKISGSTSIYSGGSLVNVNNTMSTGFSQQFSGSIKKLDYLVNGTFRQTGVFRDAKGEVISPYYGLGETKIFSGFTKLGYTINDNHAVQLMYNSYSSNQSTNYTVQNGEYGKRATIGVLGETKGIPQGNRYNHNAQLKYTVKNLPLKSTAELSLYMQEFKTVYGYSTYFADPDKGYDGGQSQIESSKKGVRLNLNTPFDLSENLSGQVVYGFDLLNDITEQGLADGRSWVPKMNMTNLAPYAQFKLRLYKKFILKAGARYENIGINIKDYTTIYVKPYGTYPPNGGVAVKGGKLNYNALVYNLGLRYTMHELFNPFVSYSQSFSIADLGRTLRSAKENTVASIKSEAVIANNYEVGFNGNFKNLNYGASGYISTSKLGSTYKESNGTFEIARQPERVYGFEMEADYTFLKKVDVGGSFTYVEGKYDGNNDEKFDGENDDYLSGDRIPPTKTVAFIKYRVNYQFDIKLQGVFTGERKHFELNKKGKYDYGKGPVSSIQLINLYSSYRLNKNTRLVLGVENLLNADYYTQTAQWTGRDSYYTRGNGTRFNLSLTINY